MLAWLGAITAAFQFATQLIKLVNEDKKGCKSEVKDELKAINKAFAEGRKKGDLSDLEKRFKKLGIGKPSSDA